LQQQKSLNSIEISASHLFRSKRGDMPLHDMACAASVDGVITNSQGKGCNDHTSWFVEEVKFWAIGVHKMYL